MSRLSRRRASVIHPDHVAGARSRFGAFRGGRGFLRFARTNEGALFVSIVAMLIAGVTAAILQPGAIDGAFAREAGALLAPPSESSFTDAWGRPGTPAGVIEGSTPLPTPPGGPPPGPNPRAPTPSPAPVAPPGVPDEPPGDGLLPDLPILPPLPQALPFSLPANEHAAMSREVR